MQDRLWTAWIVAIVLALPTISAAQPYVGVTMWRHDTDMKVNRATDWDGSNNTAEERGKDWDLKSSGVGAQAGYLFGEMFTLEGNIGVAQATTRSVNVSDADFDMTSRGLDEGLFLSIGASASADFPGSENMFWGASLAARTFSSEFDQDVSTKWELDETTVSIGGRVGYLVRGVGLYGGLRFVSDDSDIKVTDVSRIPGEQTRSISIERNGGTDLLVGAEVRGLPMTGFVEVGFLGSFGASTGLAMHY